MGQEIENVNRALIQSLKAGVTPNVAQTTHTEFSEIAALPAVLLFYPELQDYTPNETNERRVELAADQKTTTIRPPKIFKSLVFQVQILAESVLGPSGLAQLQSRFEIWKQRNATITVDENEYDLHAGTDPTRPLFGANPSNIKRLDGQIVVEGVEIDDAETAEAGYAAQESKFTMEPKE